MRAGVRVCVWGGGGGEGGARKCVCVRARARMCTCDRVCVCLRMRKRKSACLSACTCYFLVGLSANGLKTNVPLKFSSHRDAVPPTRLAVFLCSDKIADKKVAQFHWTQPLLKLLLDCMDCFHIKIPEVVFPLECSTFISSAAIFSSPMTVLWLCLWMKVRLHRVVL